MVILMSSTTSREAAIQGLRDYQQELVSSINELRESLRIVEQSIVLLSGSKQNAEITESPKQAVNQNAGPQEIVEDFLRGAPDNSYRPRELAKRIMESGYKPKTEKPEIWFAQVTNCLRRAVRKGLAEEETVEGKRRFRWKQNGQATTTR